MKTMIRPEEGDFGQAWHFCDPLPDGCTAALRLTGKGRFPRGRLPFDGSLMRAFYVCPAGISGAWPMGVPVAGSEVGVVYAEFGNCNTVGDRYLWSCGGMLHERNSCNQDVA